MDISGIEKLQSYRYVGGSLIGSSLLIAITLMTITLLIVGGAQSDVRLKLMGGACAVVTGPLFIVGLALASIAHWKLSRIPTQPEEKKVN